MPGLVDTFNSTPAAVQLTVSLYIGTFAIAQLCYGPLSDKFGRRRVILAGIGIYAVAPLLCTQATSIEALAAGRALQAIGGCAGLMFARVIARDLHGRDKAASVIASVTMISSAMTAAAPAIGGFLDVWMGWRASFVFTAALGSVVFTICLLWLPETRPSNTPARSILQTFADGVRLLRNPAFVGYAAHGACTLSGWYAMLAGLPFVLVEVFGLPKTAYGYYYPILAIGYTLGNLVTSRMATPWGANRLIVTGATIAISACIPLYLWNGFGTPSALSMFIPLGLIVLGQGISQPGATSSAIGVRPDLAGSAAGMMGFSQWMIAAGTSQLMGVIIDGTIWPTIWMASFFAVMSLAAYLFARWGEARAERLQALLQPDTENS